MLCLGFFAALLLWGLFVFIIASLIAVFIIEVKKVAKHEYSEDCMEDVVSSMDYFNKEKEVENEE